MHITKFFYNVQTKECEFFVYSGCGGNANNFMSAVECESNCKKGSTVLIQMPMTKPSPKDDSNKKSSNSSVAKPTTTATGSNYSNKASTGSKYGNQPSTISASSSLKESSSELDQSHHKKRTLTMVASSYFANKSADGVTRTFAVDGEDCKKSQYGCCSDGNSPATGENGEGCVEKECPCPGIIVEFGIKKPWAPEYEYDDKIIGLIKFQIANIVSHSYKS